ncbi:ABC transporter substrate-binding protein [Diplocloster agilis]|uniref:ABC transporter substrate-binding protein n=1 Tax=Diplocloster agilis TaxID=2850323 RepID=UPI00130D56E0|nr:extracellular solute-binding protein [Suonthocola fibrivorans]MCU6732337.1 extracellular solute-binding protein [Suonthocola fibrivorans]
MIDPLENYSSEYGWKDSLLSPLYEACTVDGKLYSIPVSLNTVGLFYNKKVMEENGWELPKSVDDLTAIMDEAMSKGLYATLAGNKGWRPNNENYTTLMLNYFAGPDVLYDCLSGTKDWTCDEMKEAVDLSAQWYQKGYLAGDDYVNLSSSEAMALLASGKSPFAISPSLFFQFAADYFNDENGNADDRALWHFLPPMWFLPRLPIPSALRPPFLSMPLPNVRTRRQRS